MKKLSSSFTYLTIECEIMIKNKINKCSIDTHEKAMKNQSLLVVSFFCFIKMRLAHVVPSRHRYRMRKLKRLMFFSATPVPLATESNGSSAMWNLIPILSVNRLSRPRISAPPPAR